MANIKDYYDLISLIPVNQQSALIKKTIWGGFEKEDPINAIFGDKQEVEISREDVFSEDDIEKKAIMVLMWGYPTGGRGKNIEKIIKKFDTLVCILESVKGNNFTMTEAKADNLIKGLDSISGVGISTWSKFLYFFNVSIDSMKCQIFDEKIVDSLNKKQFEDLGIDSWSHTKEDYFRYIELVNNLATSMKVLPEQIELFLFYYNLSYKFTE